MTFNRRDVNDAYVGRLALLIWSSFLLSFSALLPVMNPPAGALLFIGLMGDQPPDLYRVMARRIAFINVLLLVVIEALGSAIFKFFGISLPIIQVAGGIITAGIGWSMLNEQDGDAAVRTKEMAANGATLGSESLKQKAFYPFTFPVTSDPATLVVTITLSAQAADRSHAAGVLWHLGLFLAILSLSLFVYVCYAYAPRLTQAVPPATVHGFIRITAFILFCIGVQITWNGMAVLLPTALHL
jgi:multiple antibiotic resistance protein